MLLLILTNVNLSSCNTAIFLSLSTPFFEEEFEPVNDATVQIENLNTSDTFLFVNQGNGEYSTTSFIPILDDSYQLQINYAGEQYQANATLESVTDISRVEQTIVEGFDGEDAVNIEVFTNDIPNEDNFFFLEYRLGNELPNIVVYDDEFQDGNEIGFIYRRSFFDLDDFESGDIVSIEYQGISEDFYNYMELFLEQAANAGDPFATVPVQLNGNGTNTTNPDKKPYGFFRLGEMEKIQIVID